ncbi:hypothetical protein D3C76_1139580 [compost metagenome]
MNVWRLARCCQKLRSNTLHSHIDRGHGLLLFMWVDGAPLSKQGKLVKMFSSHTKKLCSPAPCRLGNRRGDVTKTGDFGGAGSVGAFLQPRRPGQAPVCALDQRGLPLSRAYQEREQSHECTLCPATRHPGLSEIRRRPPYPCVSRSEGTECRRATGDGPR